MDNAQILVEYCKNKMLPNELFTPYIYRYPNFIFTYMKDDPRIDSKAIAITRTMLAMQKKNTESIKREIITYQSFGYKIIGLKGLFLQRSYYQDEHVRIFGDIDIFVKKNKGISIYKKLRRLGYRVEKRDSLYGNITHGHLAISFLRGIYLSQNKDIRMTNNNSIILEMHTNINSNCSFTCNTRFNMDRMFDEAVEKDVGDMKFYIFSPVDNLLYLMFHSIKHLCYIDLHGNRLSINLQSFFDIAQIISNEKINWQLFCDRAIEYNVTPFVSLFLRLFVDIYQNTIPAEVSEAMLAHTQSIEFGWKYIFNELTKMDPSEIILGDYRKLPEVIQYYRKTKSEDPKKVWRQFYDDHA